MRRLFFTIACGLLFVCSGPAWGDDVEQLSLEELLAIEIDSAAKFEQKPREAPASVTVITAEEIARFGYRTLAEVLTHVRSFYVSDDRNYAYLGVRGFSRPTDFNSRVLLLLNGQRANENYYGSTSVGGDFSLNLESVERIEIVRGPGSALYGTGAMFAVINIVTRKGEEQDGVRLTAEAGSFESKYAGVVYGSRSKKGFDILLGGQWIDAAGEDLYFPEYDDPATNDAWARGADWETGSGAMFTLGYEGLSFQAFHSSRKKGIPTGSYEADFGDDRNQTLDVIDLLDLGYELKLGQTGEASLRGYYNGYHYEGRYYYDGALYQDRNDGTYVGAEGELSWSFDKHHLVLGGEYQDHLEADYYSNDDGEVLYDKDIPYRVAALYVQDSWRFSDRLSATVGLRYDHYSDVGGAATPRLALIYHPFDRGTLKVLYGEAFRRPNHYEVYYGDLLFNKGNPDLDPERIRTSELVWEQQFADSWFGLGSVYRYDMKDLISAFVDPADGLVQFRNIDRVQAWGAEAEIRARFERGIWGYASFTYQIAEDEAISKRLTNSPSHLLRTGVNVPLFHKLYAGAEVRYESDRRTVYETDLDPYLVVDLHVTSALLFEHLRMGLHVLNATDQDYSTPGGFEHIQGGIPMPGRVARFTVGLQF